MHIPSSVDTDLDILSLVYGEPKPHHQFGESTSLHKTYFCCTCTIIFYYSIFKSQIGENISALPLVLLLLIMIFSHNDIPIALRKGKRSCTSHSISRFVSYSHLSPSFHAFIYSMDSYSIHKFVSKALSIPE